MESAVIFISELDLDISKEDYKLNLISQDFGYHYQNTTHS